MLFRYRMLRTELYCPAPVQRAACLLAVISFAVAGCSLTGKTVEKDGTIGSTLTGPHGLAVTLVKYDKRTPKVERDITGLASAPEGTHFVAFEVKVCVGDAGLPTISGRNFTADLAKGGEAEQKFPQTVYPDDFDLVGTEGCEQGHLVFIVPRGDSPTDLKFDLDYSKPSPDGTSSNTKVRFTWTL